MSTASADLAGANGSVDVASHPGLYRELRRLNGRLRELVAACRRPGPEDPLQPFRGLVVSDEEAACLLDDLDERLARLDRAPRFPVRGGGDEPAGDDGSPL